MSININFHSFKLQFKGLQINHIGKVPWPFLGLLSRRADVSFDTHVLTVAEGLGSCCGDGSAGNGGKFGTIRFCFLGDCFLCTILSGSVSSSSESEEMKRGFGL
jgi:hypothetical protein